MPQTPVGCQEESSNGSAILLTMWRWVCELCPTWIATTKSLQSCCAQNQSERLRARYSPAAQELVA